VIERLSNARTRLIRSLHRKKGRADAGAYLAEGERLLDELPSDLTGVRFLFGVKERGDWLEEKFPRATIYLADEHDSDLFATEKAQGVGAVIDIPSPISLPRLASNDAPLLLLDAIADPGNAGTIIRTAEWFGLGGVLLGRGSVDLHNPKTVRSTMGAIFRLPVIEQISVEEILDLRLPLVALDAGGGEYLGAAELPRHAIYVIGSEAHGVSPNLLAASRRIAIRGAGKGESLNAAIAAAIVCYELSCGGG
jgi:TrmH family RNA methyltransferase